MTLEGAAGGSGCWCMPVCLGLPPCEPGCGCASEDSSLLGLARRDSVEAVEAAACDWRKRAEAHQVSPVGRLSRGGEKNSVCPFWAAAAAAAAEGPAAGAVPRDRGSVAALAAPSLHQATVGRDGALALAPADDALLAGALGICLDEAACGAAVTHLTLA